MFEIPAAIRAITLGQIITLGVAGTPVATGGYWGLNKLVKAAIAEERLATQEALEDQKKLLEDVQRSLHTYNLQQGILQNDVGTVKEFQKQHRELLDEILLGVKRSNNLDSRLNP